MLFWLSLTTVGKRLLSIDREAVEIIMFYFILLILLKPFEGGLSQPLLQRLTGVGYARLTKPCRWRGERLHHGVAVCVLVFS